MLIVGNGESRKNISLKNFSSPVVGCNAIYRDYLVDHLICVDKRMVNEAIKNSFPNPIYTRKDWINSYIKNKNIFCVPALPFTGTTIMDDPFQWGSGPYAILLGSLKSKNIFIIGFDLYSNNKFVNNIYKDTANYDLATHHFINPKYWIYQISKIFSFFSNNYYTIYQNCDWQCPKEWYLPNVKVDIIENIKYNNSL